MKCKCGHNDRAHDRHGRCWDCGCNKYEPKDDIDVTYESDTKEPTNVKP